MSKSSDLTFQVALTVKKLYDIPFLSGKYHCRIKQKKHKLLELPKFLQSGAKASDDELKTQDLQMKKDHSCHFNQTFSFDANLEIDLQSYELRSSLFRISVKGQSKKGKAASFASPTQVRPTVTPSHEDEPSLLSSGSNPSSFGHLLYDELKVGFADIDLACFATGQQLQQPGR